MQKDKQINALIELNEELENYFGNTIIPQLFVDAALVLRKFTFPAMKQFKLKYEHIGRPLSEVVDNFRFSTFTDNVEQVIASGEALEKEIQTTDMRWYQMNILPYRVRKLGITNGVIITFVDVTGRVKDLKELEKLIAEHELLLDTIAHDIKNPLLALGMTIDVLKRIPENGLEKFPPLLQNAENSLKQMKKVVNDLVETRWQQHRYQPNDELLDLENILEDVRIALTSDIQSRNASIKTELEVSEIIFARRKLRSVIYNLVNNGLKYCVSERSPEIVIKSHQEGNFTLIRITDNGKGIDASELKSIFRKHYSADSETEGNGIGLYLVKEIVESAGGHIVVESVLGKGSVFNVFLPTSERIAL